MTDQIEESDDYADDIVSVKFYEPPEPSVREFLPWHKPRKHFVRSWQWEEQIRKLISEATPEDGVLKYFGLPGDDLLDIRHFHDSLCKPNNLQLRYLGFNSNLSSDSGSQVDANISIDEVSKLELIDPRSEVIPDDFCKITDDKSYAWKRTLELGAYDVINIDLCDGFGKQAPDPAGNNYYNALGSLMALQAKTKQPWLLFLTTRVGKEHINNDVMDKLVKKYQENIDGCPEFKEISSKAFNIGNATDLAEALSDEQGSSDVFITGLCKWLAGLAVDYTPPLKIELKSIIGYRVEGGEGVSDLLSIALKFTPTFSPIKDRAGLSGGKAVLFSECDFSPQILKRVLKCFNADEVLKNDENILKEMIDATFSLLELARYDVAKYPSNFIPK